MQDEHVARRAVEPLARDAEDAVVLAQRRDVARLHALELQAQDVERVGPLDRRPRSRSNTVTPSSSIAFGSSERGPHTPTSAPSFLRPQMFERATRECSTSPQMQTLQALERPEVVAQREQVEQPLRRMLVRAVAGVDHVRLDALGEELRRARRAVADDDHVDPHRLEIARRVDERLALRDARARRGDVHRVGRQPLLGELERDARARRRLEEQVDDRRAAQRRHLLDRALADLLERLGGVENAVESARRDSGSSPSRSLPSDAVTSPSSRRTTTTASRSSSSVDQHVDPLVAARPRPSCRRRRRGSAARVRRDRPARPARCAPAGRSPPARRARRARCGPCRARRRRSRRACRRCPTAGRVGPTTGRGPTVCRSSR